MKFLKRFSTFVTVALLALFACVGTASAAGIAIDPAPLTGAVDFTTVTAAITAIAVLKFGPVILRWVYGFLISIFRSASGA